LLDHNHVTTCIPIRRAAPELHSSSSNLRQAHNDHLPPLTVRWRRQRILMTL